MAVDILDTTNSSPVLVQASSQPVKFWGIKGKERYQSAYFEQYGPNVWHQGDFVYMSPVTRGYTMLGRPDGVLNPGGVRFGFAEIYNVTGLIPQFEETICVGQRRKNDTDKAVFLFVKMKDGA
ncbi:hypothetical protein IQ07DRAFT_628760 [Pyrenochaeta sp. DS3sAY3a]|nr:hypothetical protein IQ07DRAFT_628760 [Pyrenochaeta sp. DS3sAY3a]